MYKRQFLVKVAQTVSRQRLFEVIQKHKDLADDSYYNVEFDTREEGEAYMKKNHPEDWKRYEGGEEPLKLQA